MPGSQEYGSFESGNRNRRSRKYVLTRSVPAGRSLLPRSFTFHLGNSFSRLKLSRYPRSFAAPSQLYLPSRKSLSSMETQSLPSLLRCHPCSFTLYLGNPFPRLKLSSYPRSFAATLAALLSISKIPFLDGNSVATLAPSLPPLQRYLLSRKSLSSIPGFLIKNPLCGFFPVRAAGAVWDGA